MRLILIFLLFSSFVYSHSGGTDSDGCHNDYANNDFHCHHGCPPHYHDYSCEYDYEDCGTYDDYDYYDDDDDYYYSSRDSSGSSGVGWFGDIIYWIGIAWAILIGGAIIWGIIKALIIDPIREPIIKRKELERKRLEEIENEKQRKILLEKEKEEKINNLIKDAEDNPKDSKKSSSVAWEYSRRNEYELALSWFNKTLYLNPKDLVSLKKRADIKMDQKDYYLAIEDLNKAIEINPKEASCFNNRGVCYNRLNENIKALDDYDVAVKLDKNSLRYITNRAITKKRLFKLKGALRDHNKAIKLNTRDGSSYHDRGEFYWLYLNDFDSAMEDFKKALEINPGNKKYEDSIHNIKARLINLRNLFDEGANFSVTSNCDFDLNDGHLKHSAEISKSYTITFNMRYRFVEEKIIPKNFSPPKIENFDIISGPTEEKKKYKFDNKAFVEKKYIYIVTPINKGVGLIHPAEIEFDSKIYNSYEKRIEIKDSSIT